MQRRTFIKAAVATSVALNPSATLMALGSDTTYQGKIGIQLYTLRNELGKDTPGTLKKVAEAGYQQVEIYDFPGADAMLAGAKDAGLAVNSAHFNAETVVNPSDPKMSDFSKILEKAHKNGLTHLVIPHIHEHNRESLDTYKKVAENSNKAAAMAKRAGIQLSYHNHAFEFLPMDGKSGYQIYMEEFSRDMMFEIDIFWVKVAGVDPAGLIKKLKGRVSQLHLKDLKNDFVTPAYGTDIAADAFKELGTGMIPLKPILEAAKVAGVQHCHVEQDQSPDALASIKTSIAYFQENFGKGR